MACKCIHNTQSVPFCVHYSFGQKDDPNMPIYPVVYSCKVKSLGINLYSY